MIRFEDIYGLLEKAGVPLAYRQWSGAKENIPDPPYMVYYETRSQNSGADNIAYTQVRSFIIELYTDSRRDLALERRIKLLLTEAGVFYETDHAEIAEEGVHIAYFEFSVYE
ncbi:MAG: hypothetical protein NC078_04150 [Ruminococcus sp.]|nr:hypothetical protein [Ruminococcus sp.]